MAKTEGSEKSENEIALSTQTGGELSTEVNFFEGAGDGHSDFGATDFTIPYIGILQALSKPLIKGNEK